MTPQHNAHLLLTRRHFFGRAGTGLGLAALASLLTDDLAAASSLPHFAPRARRVIYLFQSGAPSQMDLFDYKPKLTDFRGKELPDSVRMGQRLTGMTAASVKKKMKQKSFAAAVNREDIEKGAQLLRLTLDEHLTNVIAAMQGAATELGF